MHFVSLVLKFKEFSDIVVFLEESDQWGSINMNIM